MNRIESTAEENREALDHVIAELAWYDAHPTEVNDLFIPQHHLRRLVQLALDSGASLK